MITVYTDGGARGNPGPSAIGVVVLTANGGKTSFGKFLGRATNNVAEYTAIEEAMVFLLEEYEQYKRDDIHFFLDSQLVQRQLVGMYKIKEPSLQHIATRIKKKIGEWGRDVKFTHIPREQNKEADRIVNTVLDNHFDSKNS